jgi:hypothetical protein
MSPETCCSCTLCRIGTYLFSEIALADPKISEIFSSLPPLARHSSLANLVTHLRRLKADARSDEILRALFRPLPVHPRSCILAFAAPHRASRHQAAIRLASGRLGPGSPQLPDRVHTLRKDARSPFCLCPQSCTKRSLIIWSAREEKRANSFFSTRLGKPIDPSRVLKTGVYLVLEELGDAESGMARISPYGSHAAATPFRQRWRRTSLAIRIQRQLSPSTHTHYRKHRRQQYRSWLRSCVAGKQESSGNFCWWARQDLNLGPTDYESFGHI